MICLSSRRLKEKSASGPINIFLLQGWNKLRFGQYIVSLLIYQFYPDKKLGAKHQIA